MRQDGEGGRHGVSNVIQKNRNEGRGALGPRSRSCAISKPLPSISTHPLGLDTLAWQQARHKKRYDRSDNAHRNKRAVSFAQNASNRKYAADAFLHPLASQRPTPQ